MQLKTSEEILDETYQEFLQNHENIRNILPPKFPLAYRECVLLALEKQANQYLMFTNNLLNQIKESE